MILSTPVIQPYYFNLGCLTMPQTSDPGRSKSDVRAPCLVWSLHLTLPVRFYSACTRFLRRKVRLMSDLLAFLLVSL